jgi:hypothetical protein
MLVVTALIAVALLRGRRYPLVGIGVVGFFAAHLIESSFIGLELYFEHRNYLPCMFLFMGCAGLLVELLEKRKIAGIVAIALIVGVCGTMTKLNAELWANNWQMFMVWAEQTPESERAQLQVAAFWADAGEYEKALDYTRKAAVARPKSPRPLIYAAAIKCYAGMPVDEAALARILEALQTYPYHQSTYNYFKELLKAKHVTRCDVPYATLTVLVEALFPDQIPSNNIRALKHYELGNLQLAQGHGAEGAAEYAKGAVMRADRQAGLVEASTLATLGFPALALEHLALVERRNNQICGVDRSLPRLNECEWLASEIVRLRSLIEIDQAQAGAP